MTGRVTLRGFGRLSRRRPGSGNGAGAGRGRLTPAAGAVMMRGFEHAVRLGCRYMGAEHVLLALAGSDPDHAAVAVLREHGVTADRIEAQLTRLAGGGLFGDLDRNALAAIGIDVDAVRVQVAGAFGAEALARSARALPRSAQTLAGRPYGGAWRRRRTGPGIHRAGVFLPHTRDVMQSLHAAHLAQQARHDTQIDVAHVALGAASATDGLVPPILAALGVSAPELRAAIAERCWGAS